MLNPRLDDLPGYPFARLRQLLDGTSPAADIPPLVMSIGEPQHAPPAFVAEVIARSADGWGKYPPLKGTPIFRRAVADWLTRRFALPQGFIAPDENVLTAAGTREAIYMFASIAVSRRDDGARPCVLVPNPLYHVYAGAALMSGAEPVFVPATAASGFMPDYLSLPDDVWARTALVYLCAPSNPQGTLASRAYLSALLAKVMAHDAILAVDECYSEIYDMEKPVGVLEACAALGADAVRALDHVIVFNSLSKRSSSPGLRSGFAVGGKRLIEAFAKLRDFASSATPLPILAAATELWRDEAHVEASRARYRAKFDLAEAAFGNRFGPVRPAGGFFLWLDMAAAGLGGGEAAAKRLWQRAAIRTLPGAFLCPEDRTAPGRDFLRVALIHDEALLAEALPRFAAALND
ncbi:MAG TPA: aminotransferase class I/II-fold pyridoxal phosphate-dependent enzyme [Alphaproteobacteria bacterium]|jgi:N-succinyldiaminopimelate aminotransferase